MDWEAKRVGYRALIEEREAAAAKPDSDPGAGRVDFQVAALATASWAAGLAGLMTGRADEARVSLSASRRRLSPELRRRPGRRRGAGRSRRSAAA